MKKSIRLTSLTSLTSLASATSLALLAATTALPARASSTAASSASEGASASVGSVSTSFEKSSDGSSKKDKAAAGDYKVIDVAEVAERPGTLRLRLQPLAQGQEASADAGGDTAADAVILYVPAKALAQSPLATGDVVAAKPRPYGVEFARADTGRAFFLVLQDDWYRELQSNAVVL